MKKLVFLFLFTFPLLAGNLTLKEGFVAAHTEMALDSTIDPLNNNIKTDLNMHSEEISSLRGIISVEMDLFVSDNSDRDEHMDEAVDVKNFPLASYTISKMTKTEGKDNYKMDGTLDFHGQKKELSFNAEVLLQNNLLTINATSQILMSDYGVEIPCLMFMCVRDQIDLFAKAVLEKQ